MAERIDAAVTGRTTVSLSLLLTIAGLTLSAILFLGNLAWGAARNSAIQEYKLQQAEVSMTKLEERLCKIEAQNTENLLWLGAIGAKLGIPAPMKPIGHPADKIVRRIP